MTSRLTRTTLTGAIAVLSFASTACFSIQTLIKLHPDGSGTIEQTNLVNGAMIGMAAGMAKSVAGEAGKDAKVPSVDELFSEEQLRQQAAMMGAGVRFVSSERLSQSGLQGARAIYEFDRVQDLTVGGGTRLRDGGASGPSAPPMRFALAPLGASQRLTVTMSEGQPAAAPPPDTPAAQPIPQIPPEAFAMVKSMFEGARMSVEVEVDGRIVSTTAPASSGARATLVAIDFGELLSDPSRLQALQTIKPGADFATVRKVLEGMKGVTLPADRQVTVDFVK